GLADSNARFTAIENEVKAAVGPQGGLRNYVVFADDVQPVADTVAGIGERLADDSADPGNGENAGGWYAMVFGRGGSDFFNGGEPYAGKYILHEITHTLGAAPLSAPHTTGAGHCTAQYDVMCYADGGPTNTPTQPCNTANRPTN